MFLSSSASSIFILAFVWSFSGRLFIVLLHFWSSLSNFWFSWYISWSVFLIACFVFPFTAFSRLSFMFVFVVCFIVFLMSSTVIFCVVVLFSVSSSRNDCIGSFSVVYSSTFVASFVMLIFSCLIAFFILFCVFSVVLVGMCRHRDCSAGIRSFRSVTMNAYRQLSPYFSIVLLNAFCRFFESLSASNSTSSL